MSGLLVLGALHHDVVVDAPGLPRVDETLVGSAVDYRFGGKGGNQAVAAARMGAAVRMLGRVGPDTAGAAMRSALAAAGVDHSSVQEVDVPSGMSVAITLPDGSYGAVIVSAANLANDGTLPPGPPPKVALIQNEVPAAANQRFARELPEDCTLIWNAAPARGLDELLLARVDLMIVNRVEAEDLTGFKDPELAAEAQRAQGTAEVIVTLGGEGLIYANTVGQSDHPAFPAKVISTHGAGDMFTGALAARLSLGDSVATAIPFAQMAAALFVSAPIAERAALTATDVHRALNQAGAGSIP